MTAADPSIRIEIASTDAQLAATWPVMRQLRPHLDEARYIAMVRSMASEGYRVAALHADGRVVAVAGYRFMTMLYAGKLLYLDDLVTDESSRSHGYGKRLLDWLKQQARDHGCAELQLISHTKREGAHRFYFREGFAIECFEFRWKVE
jgi:GNAT superfamily N-acetyltransferase